MDRRKYLRRLCAVGSFVTLAGCNSSEAEPENQSPEEDDSSQTTLPSLNWSVSWERGVGYTITVDTELNDADQIKIRKKIQTGDTIATISTSGRHTIAGPGTEYGPIKDKKTLWATYPSEYNSRPTGFESHVVGSEVGPTYPMFMNGLQVATIPELEDAGYTEKTYTYSSGGWEYNTTIQIPDILVEYYEDRHRTREFGAYVSDSYDDNYLNTIVEGFESEGQERNATDEEILTQMAHFVQHLEYTDDKVGTGYNEYPKFPLETLYDRDGDCEDTAILLGAMLEQFGYDTILIAIPENNHMVLGVAGEEDLPGAYVEHQGRQYYYLETTAPGYGIGDAPDDTVGAETDLYPIDKNPVLVFRIVMNLSQEGGLKVESAINNIGDAPATNTRLKVQFEGRQGEVLETVQSDRLQISASGEEKTEFYAYPPADRGQRVRASVLIDGELHDETTSEFRESPHPESGGF